MITDKYSFFHIYEVQRENASPPYQGGFRGIDLYCTW